MIIFSQSVLLIQSPFGFVGAISLYWLRNKIIHVMCLKFSICCLHFFDLFPLVFSSIDLFVGQSVRPFLGFLAQLPSGFLRPILDAGILVNLFLPIDLLRPLLAEVWRKRFLFRHISEKENGEPLKQHRHSV